MTIIVLVGLAMLGIGLAGGYFLFGGKSEKSSQVPLQNVQQTTQTSPTVTTSINAMVDTSTWATYNSSKYDFTIKYPKDWIVDESTSPNAVYFRKENPSDDTKQALEKLGYEMHVVVSENASYKESVTHIKEVVDTRPESSIQEITFLGYPAYRAVDTALDFPGTFVEVYRNNSSYGIGNSVFSDSRKDADEILNEMLKTFKFTN